MKLFSALVIALTLFAIDVHAQTVTFIDEGINVFFSRQAKSKYVDQGCVSGVDIINSSLTPDIRELSHCKNGQRLDFVSTEAATFPRSVKSPNGGQTVSAGRKLFHGNAVSSAIWSFSRNVFQQPITVTKTKYNSAKKIHEGVLEFQNILDSLGFIAFGSVAQNTDAVNVSLALLQRNASGQLIEPRRCAFKEGQAFINELDRRNVVVTAGLPNVDIPRSASSWPACLTGTINVGSSEAKSAGRGIGIGRNTIQYFSDGTLKLPNPPNNAGGGNSFAAPRVATAFAILRSEFPGATIAEMKAAIDVASTSTTTYTVRYGPNDKDTFIERKLRKSDLAKARQVLSQIQTTPLTQPQLIAANRLNFVDFRKYGPKNGEAGATDHRFDISFSGTEPVVSNAATPITQQAPPSFTGKRDVILTFTGNSDTLSSTHFDILVNNRLVERVSNFRRNVDKTVEVAISRRFFDRTDNTIEIDPFSGQPWGIKDVILRFYPIVDLRVGALNSSEYGSEQSVKRFTGVRAKFSIPNNTDNDYSVSMIGWDIDTADETAVFLNGTFVGHLSKNPLSSAYGVKDTFFLSKANLLEGDNYIELVQREIAPGVWEGFEDEKWAVKDFKVEKLNSDLAVNSVLVNDRNVKASQPFGTTVSVINNGLGSSNATMIRYYISDDKIITPADSEIGIEPIVSVGAGQIRSITKSLTSNLVERSKFLGVCVDMPVGEVNISNNCSEGVSLNAGAAIVPTMMLLLED